jgi:hypothetical protein
MTEEIDMLAAATRKFERTRKAHDAAKAEVIQAALDALRAGERPTDVADKSPFTPAYIRRIARDAGIEPAAPGPKPKRGE